MASSSSSSWRYDVFPSFRGEDVRKSFLSHFLKELRRKSIDTFIDNNIERSLPIDPALLLAIKESRISIVIFSKNYASSTWCLNELVEIHKCFKELKQMVIPIFYDVVPSDVRKQTGEFGKLFEETCKGKPEDHKQSWMQALIDVANMAGYDLLTWPDEANLIETITNDISNKLVTPSSDLGDVVGLEAHLERLSSMLCLESEEAIMVGIVGPSGIGKSTIGRALYRQHSGKFHHHTIFIYERTTIVDNYRKKLSWEQQFLSKILGQKDIEIDELGEVEKRLKHRKVLIILDDVVELEFLKTLVGKTEWFGPGSRIIVITQNRQLLKAHEIDHMYEVEFPSEGLALEMLCRYAFGKNSPPNGFRELAVEVAKLAGNLPLGLSALGSSLKGMGKDEWVEMLPRLRDDLDGRIEKTLRASYDRLDEKDKELFLSIACFFKGEEVSVIKDLFGSIGLRMLADKFLIRITPKETVEMHDLLQKLGIDIDREESERQPSRRRFLTNAEDILDVLTDNNGNKSVLGISLEVTEPFSIDENSFKGMPNLQYIIIHYSFLAIWNTNIRLDLPQGLNYLPRKLKLLKWDKYPAKCLPSNFNAKNLVILKMKRSKLEKLWEGNQWLESLVKLELSLCMKLTEFPDLSKATNLERLIIRDCESLERVPSTIRNLQKLKEFDMSCCYGLEVLPIDVNLASLSCLEFSMCLELRTFPQISKSIKTLNLSYTAIEEVPCCIDNFSRLTSLTMSSCQSLKNICPKIFRLTHLKVADFSYCEMLTMEGHFSCIPLYGNIEKRSMSFFNFRNCSKLDGNARERILRSCFKFMVLPAGEMPTYFKHRASGNNLTITLPQSSLSQEFLRFQACVVVGHSIKDIDPILNVHLYFNDEYEYEYEVTEFDRLGNFDDYDEMVFEMGNMDHLVSCSFKFRPTVLPSKLDVNDVKFKFSSSKLIKGCGVQLLSVSPSPDISSGRSETEYKQQFGEKADVVETGTSKKRMRMTSGTSEEYFNLPFGQIVADTGSTFLDLELSLGQGEVSSVSSYPSSVEGEEALITELQDAEIPIVDKSWKERAFKLSEPLPWDQF